ncbi:uncharacterized protein An02g10770 [Aspergillus niger]|uniref:Contig An02c0310, genomic contig n=2 Tax=Aspergillus niger TaxID=5061 RepID=A5AAI4_ASPNC|nr:uncharacterized protein An02g10770 [Aspergillus niger]CAK44426.1 unnamed protein product [Aspergillus niger]
MAAALEPAAWGRIYPGFKVNGNGSALKSSFPFGGGRRVGDTVRTKKYGFHSGHSTHTHFTEGRRRRVSRLFVFNGGKPTDTDRTPWGKK